MSLMSIMSTDLIFFESSQLLSSLSEVFSCSAFLWVAELNPRAIAFYRKNRFEPDGERTVSAERENLVEIRMVR